MYTDAEHLLFYHYTMPVIEKYILLINKLQFVSLSEFPKKYESTYSAPDRSLPDMLCFTILRHFIKEDDLLPPHPDSVAPSMHLTKENTPPDEETASASPESVSRTGFHDNRSDALPP